MASADQLDADVVRRLGRIAFAPVNEAIDRTPDNRRFGFYAKTRGWTSRSPGMAATTTPWCSGNRPTCRTGPGDEVRG